MKMTDEQLWDSLPSASVEVSARPPQKLWQPILGYKHNPKRVQPFPLDVSEKESKPWQVQL